MLRRSAASVLVRTLVVGAIVLAAAGCGRPSGISMARAGGPTYALMQMNLCLSGLAGCYDEVEYPAGILEAVAAIQRAHPDAVTLNEVCRGDVASIARRAGYQLRFARVIYHGKPLACVRPSRRGLFGDAMLIRGAIGSVSSHAFHAQAGPERREWLCVGTRIGVEVCTAHLASHEADEVAANAPQCAELRALLARRWAARGVLFGGDLNRRGSCAPSDFWARTDGAARQDPGVQQVYGTGALRSPGARVLPARHTDHDFLLVRAYLSARR